MCAESGVSGNPRGLIEGQIRWKGVDSAAPLPSHMAVSFFGPRKQGGFPTGFRGDFRDFSIPNRVFRPRDRVESIPRVRKPPGSYLEPDSLERCRNRRVFGPDLGGEVFVSE